MGTGHLIVAVTGCCLALILPILRTILLTPRVSFQESLQDPHTLLYLVAIDCPKSDCHDQFHTDVFHQHHHLLAKSFRAARLLGANRANYATAVHSRTGRSGTLIGVSSQAEAEKVLSNVEVESKKIVALQGVSVELVWIPTTGNRSVLTSFGFFEGWLAGFWLPWKLTRAARSVAQQHGVNLDDEAPWKTSFYNVIPRKQSQAVDFGLIFFLGSDESEAQKKHHTEKEQETQPNQAIQEDIPKEDNSPDMDNSEMKQTTNEPILGEEPTMETIPHEEDTNPMSENQQQQEEQGLPPQDTHTDIKEEL